MSGIINPGQRRTDSALDLVVKGLQIARDVYGIKEAATAAERADEERKKKGDEEARVKAGLRTPGEYQAIQLSGKYEEVSPGTPGGIRIPMEGGGEKYVGLRVPKKPEDPRLALDREKFDYQKVQDKKKGAGGGGTGGGTWSTAGNMTDTDGTPLLLNNKTGEILRADGTPPQSIGKSKPATAEQFKVAGFARRLEQSEDVFADLEKQGYDRTDKTGAAFNAIVPRAFESDDYKTQEQAERNFVNAVLRRESGAAISPTEFENAEQQYFPRPGDPPQLVEQKAANRKQVLETLRAEASNALDKVPRIEAVATKKNSATPGPGTAVAAPAQKAQPSPDDQAALQWLQQNEKAPEAEAVRQTLRAKGLL
jgi:hypothetical protein